MPKKPDSFLTLLTKWNNGISRGSQSRFAETINVAKNTVSRWVTGDLLPGEEIRQKIADELEVSISTLNKALNTKPSGWDLVEANEDDDAQITFNVPPAIYAKFVKKSAEDRRSPVDQLLWLMEKYSDDKLTEGWMELISKRAIEQFGPAFKEIGIDLESKFKEIDEKDRNEAKLKEIDDRPKKNKT